jgi:hypothetical protein
MESRSRLSGTVGLVSELTIVSNHGARSLTIHKDDATAGYWIAELHGEAVRAKRRFYSYDRTGLADYFAGLAASWRGWDGDETWAALEGDVSIAASHDGKGTVAMLVELSEWPTVRRDPDWRAALVLTIDAGSLNRLAREAKAVD